MTETMMSQGFDYYTKIFNEAIEGLTPAEIGVYLHMKAQNTKWEFNLEYMATLLNVTYYQIRKLVRQLISKGLVARIQKRVHGFIKYDYKVRDKKGQVRDDAVKMRREQSEEKLEQPVEVTTDKVITEIEPVAAVEIKQEEKKDWKALFKGHEDLISDFIEDRKKHLRKCDFYKKQPDKVTDTVARGNIQRKMDEVNSTMPELISEFIASKLKEGKIKENKEKEVEINPTQKLKNEMQDKISVEQTALSKARFPDLWAEFNGFLSFNFMAKRRELEQSIKPEFEAIANKYKEIYTPLMEKINE